MKKKWWRKIRIVSYIVLGYLAHLTIEGLVVNLAWFSFIKPTILTIL